MTRLCSICKTGELTYMQDNTETLCPYLFCYKDGKCAYYEPLTENNAELSVGQNADRETAECARKGNT